MESNRISSIDIVRGIAMIIMPLDHVRDLLHESSLSQSPTDLSSTTLMLFFTRWITHVCAPIFVFLAGSSAYRMLVKTNDLAYLQSFMLKRGIFLVLLEFLVVNSIIYFDPGFHNLLFEVIAAIGFGFVVLSFMLHWRTETILIIALMILCLHGALATIPDSLIKTILAPLFTISQFTLPDERVITIAYPPIPWLGIMLLGYASGKVFDLPPISRFRTFLWLGGVALMIFGVLRLLNIYGEPIPWTAQKNTILTGLSFINVSKYPPSLLFSLVTLGTMFLFLAYAEKSTEGIARFFKVYGKVPLFYFISHFLLIHILLLFVLLWQGFSWAELDFASGTFGRPKDAASGLPLSYIFVIWVGIVVVLYRPCIWFAAYKRRTHSLWLKYL